MDDKKQMVTHEKVLNAKSGWGMLMLTLLMYLAVIGGVVATIYFGCAEKDLPCVLMLILSITLLITAIIIDCGLKVLKPNEALVFTFFGKYVGTLKKDGFFYVNPFYTAVNPNFDFALKTTTEKTKNGEANAVVIGASKKISLKAMTMRNERQKINDLLNISLLNV